MPQWNVIGETEPFSKGARSLFSEDALNELKSYLACNPEAGDIIPETGGVRKLRWRAKGKGKSGGARVIYFFHNADLPLYLLAVYTKNEKIDLSAAERSDMRALGKAIVSTYKKRKRRSG